ncbi:MAG TPA: thioredoxin domain-containing protein [Methanotrichaceae archaeon]|nr:thioredoxin domain-containing protein [Methanotrichaceae archaeon]
MVILVMAMNVSGITNISIWKALAICCLVSLAFLAHAQENSSEAVSQASLVHAGGLSYTPLTVNDSNMDSVIRDHPLLVIDGWKEGCDPCQSVDSVVDEMARDFEGRVTFGKLRVDKNLNAFVKYQIYNFPTLLIFKNGTLVHRQVGNYPKPELEKMIQENLGIA